MRKIEAYFDGTAVRPLEPLFAKPNQRITMLIHDDFLDSAKFEAIAKSAGSLKEFANPTLIEREKTAWEEAVAEKYASH